MVLMQVNGRWVLRIRYIIKILHLEIIKMSCLDVVSTLSNLATTVGVFLAARQLKLTKKHAVTSFEDSFAKEYRTLASQLPLRVFLGEELDDEEHFAYLDTMYQYFDLCNEQAFLHKSGRISDETWQFWQVGIETNLRRPAFGRAWSEISEKTKNDFSELRRIFPPSVRLIR